MSDSLERSRLFVVTMGVNARPDRRCSSLRYAAGDADAIRQGFASQSDYARTVTMRFTEGHDRARVLTTLAAACAQTTPSDALVFYYAGHGLMEIDERGQAGLYLMCGGVHGTAIPETALPLATTIETLSRACCHTLLVALDCCYSGGRGSRSLLGPVALALQQGGRGVSAPRIAAPPGPGRVVLHASGHGQPAHEREELGHGIFTHCLLEELGGGDGARSIAISDLYSAVKRRCVALTFGTQCPAWAGSDENSHIPRFGDAARSVA